VIPANSSRFLPSFGWQLYGDRCNCRYPYYGDIGLPERSDRRLMSSRRQSKAFPWYMPAEQLLPIFRQDSEAFISAYYVGNSVHVILVGNHIDSSHVHQLSPLTDQSEEILRLLNASSLSWYRLSYRRSYRIFVYPFVRTKINYVLKKMKQTEKLQKHRAAQSLGYLKHLKGTAWDRPPPLSVL
jgi:hypothetical protein